MLDNPYYSNAIVFGPDGKKAQTILSYFDTHQPIWYEFTLLKAPSSPNSSTPDAETVAPIQGKYSGKAKLKLAGKPYQALRFRVVG